MTNPVDLRNELNIDCPRAKGMYAESAPAEIWTNPGTWVLEDKIDGDRETAQFTLKGILLVGRNRQDFLKGVNAAGAFRCHSLNNLALSRLVIPELDGTMLDGELTEICKQDGTWDKDTKHRFEEEGWVGYTTWGCMFWRGKDVRTATEEDRYDMAREVVRTVNQHAGREVMRLVRRVPATIANLQEVFDSHKEGAIAKKLGVGIPIDTRANRYWWKLKSDANRTVDAFIIDATEGKSGGSGVRGVKPQPSGMVATFTVAMYRGAKIEGNRVVGGEIVEVGKTGVGELNIKMEDAKSYHLKVVEMRASGWNGKALRWLMFRKFREDKTALDCLFEEQVQGNFGKENNGTKH